MTSKALLLKGGFGRIVNITRRVREHPSVQASSTAQHIKSADRCHREVTFVVYMQWQTCLPSTIYTTNNTPCAGCTYYLLAHTGSTSAAKLSLVNSSKERRHRASLFCFIFESIGGGGGELAHQQTQKKQTTLSSRLLFVVGIPGFEPGTPCSQSRCANRPALHPVLP